MGTARSECLEGWDWGISVLGGKWEFWKDCDGVWAGVSAVFFIEIRLGSFELHEQGVNENLRSGMMGDLSKI